MNQSEFERFGAQGFTRIPLSCELIADLDNPVTTFLKLADQPYTFLLESVQGGEKWGRYSIIGLPARQVIRVRGHRIETRVNDAVVDTVDVDDPIAWIDTFNQQFRVPEVAGLPRITGGLVGYFGYDTIRYIEPRLGENTHPDPLDNPDILMMVTDELVVFDNLSGKLTLLVLVDPSADDAYASGLGRLASLHDRLRRPLQREVAQHTPRSIGEEDFESGFTESGFKDAVKKIIRYITDGECMQVVLSQRLTIPFTASTFDLLSRPAHAESVTVYVLSRSRRSSCGGRVSRDSRASGGWRGHGPAAGRYPATR